MRARGPLLLLLAFAGLAPSAHAQQADVIRGRVTNDRAEVIAGATVDAVSIPGNLKRSARTDAAGRYTITFASGDGDYWVTVIALGFAPRRFEVKRLADEQILLGDVRLTPAGVVLDAVRVEAARGRPGRNDTGDAIGTEKTVGTGAVDPALAGNLAAMAASVPGVQVVPGADGNPDQFSVFGLGGDQNSTSLNGLGFGGAEVPRDAAIRASLNTTPWDVSRGGFSGAQLNLITQAGSNFSSRAVSSLVNAPSAQWTDRAGRALGAEFRSLSLGAATAGPMSLDKTFYSIGYQFDRRLSDMSNLGTANPYALYLAGVAPDSVSRMRTLLNSAGVPIATSGLPALRTTDRGLLLASFDVAPTTSTSGQALNVTAVGSYSSASSPFAQVTGFPTNDAKSLMMFGGVQLRHTNYFGVGVLSETSIGLNANQRSTRPYAELPNGGVRVASTLDDGSDAIAGLTFGGSQIQRTTNRGSTVNAQNQLSWFSANNKHRIKLSVSGRFEDIDQDASSNQLGTFRYNSLADLAAGTPASFTRLLSPRRREARQLATGVSLGDSYRPSTGLQLEYGVRVDGNRFLNTPAINDVLAQSFGVDNSRLPERAYLSPRVGFSWTYGQAAQLAVANGFVRAPRAVLRGGVGVFQNVPSVQSAALAVSNTGLIGAQQEITCVGAAVPIPDWTLYAADPANIPTQCAAGGGTFSSASRDISLFARNFAAPRSLRTNLNWSGAVLRNRLAATLDATYSRNGNQSGVVNLNFTGAQQFALGREANRPVYVPASAIVPATGASAPGLARWEPTLGSVLEQRSGLSSTNRSFTVSVQPVLFSSTYAWRLAYAYSNTRDEAYGFAGTSGDPRSVERGRSPLDARHQVIYSLSYNLFNWFPVGWSGTFRSGRPYSPLVAGDVNGDGFLNDRAFVFDPTSASTDPATAQTMRALLTTGAGAARRCLEPQRGFIASRNSCQGPWTTTSSLTIGINPVKARLPQRANISLFVNNPIGAADLLMHGDGRRRGWGQDVIPDPTLLYVRGFDPSRGEFRYEVNPRFGATDPARSVNRSPVIVTLQVRYDIGFTRERQLLTMSLDRGRSRPGERSSSGDIKAMGAALIPPNPMAALLRDADTLRLDRRQADSLSTLNRSYSRAYDAIWTPVGKFLSELPPEYDREEAYARYRVAREQSIDALLPIVPHVRALLSPAQLRKLPPQIVSSLDRQYLLSVRSSTAGNTSMGVMGMLAQMGWMGGTVDANSSTVMIHR